MVLPAQQPKNLPMPGQGRFLWWTGRPTIRAIGRAFFHLEVEHNGPLPEPPFVVAANHYSHFDPPLVGAALDTPIRFLALEDLFGVSRFVTWVIGGFGSIPVPRNRLAIATLRVALARLEVGENIGVFPEGIRVRHWGELPPKRGAAWLSVRKKVPLVPVAVVGTGRVFGIDNRLHRGKLRVVIGKALSPTGEDATALTKRWAAWMTDQMARFPDSEVSD